METKTEKNPCFARTRYSLTKLCNIFDEAFLFDVSIIKQITFEILQNTEDVGLRTDKQTYVRFKVPTNQDAVYQKTHHVQ